MNVPSFLLQHTITVEPYLGASAHGPAYGDPVTVPAYVESSRRTERDTEGRQRTSSAEVWTQLDPGVNITTDARITVWDRPAEVLRVQRFDGGALPVPSHLKLTLR